MAFSPCRWDRGMVHQWTERLVEQEIRIGILRTESATSGRDENDAHAPRHCDVESL
jgi:hypothetical protein